MKITTEESAKLIITRTAGLLYLLGILYVVLAFMDVGGLFFVIYGILIMVVAYYLGKYKNPRFAKVIGILAGLGVVNSIIATLIDFDQHFSWLSVLLYAIVTYAGFKTYQAAIFLKRLKDKNTQ